MVAIGLFQICDRRHCIFHGAFVETVDWQVLAVVGAIGIAFACWVEMFVFSHWLQSPTSLHVISCNWHTVANRYAMHANYAKMIFMGRKVLSHLMLVFLLIVGLWQNARAQSVAVPEWVQVPYEELVRADREFFYARGVGSTLQTAKAAGRLEFAELVQVNIEVVYKSWSQQREEYLKRKKAEQEVRETTARAAAEAGTDTPIDGEIVEQTTEMTAEDRLYAENYTSEELVNATTQEIIVGAEMIAKHENGATITVLMRVPRSTLPEFLAVIPTWQPPSGAIGISHVSTESVSLAKGQNASLRVDDPLVIYGRDRSLPFLRRFGRGRVASVDSDSTALELIDDANLPDATYLWAEPRSEAGIGIGLQLNLHTIDAPAFSSFNLNFASSSAAFSIGLPLEWNLGRLLGVSELWVFVEPSIMPANPVLSFGFDVGFIKRFRLRQISLGVGAAFVMRWHFLDTTGTSVLINGSSPTSMSQAVVGGALFAEIAWDISFEWTLAFRAGGRFVTDQPVWSASGESANIGYSFNEGGLLIRFVGRYRF